LHHQDDSAIADRERLEGLYLAYVRQGKQGVPGFLGDLQDEKLAVPRGEDSPCWITGLAVR
jgi:hypothetical protein